METSVPISIVAMGARTPVGLLAASTAAAVRAGIGRVREHAFFVDEKNEPLRGASDLLLDPALIGWERLAGLAHAALQQVGPHLAPCPADIKIAVLVAGPEHRPGWTHVDEQQLVVSLAQRRLGGRAIMPTLAGRGHSGALYALQQAVEMIHARVIDIAVICGVDGYFDPQTAQWLLDNRQWLSPGFRGGFFPGEAAGAIAITSTPLARALRLHERARVLGVGSAMERERIKTNSNNLGVGLADAIHAAIAKAGGIDAPIDAVWCDINGERFRSEEWGFALLRSQGAFVNPTDYEAPCELWGDVGAASGTLLTILAVQAWNRHYARGPRALVFAGSEAGQRTALLLAQTPS